MKGKTVKCDGSYGLHSYTLLPIPENPPTIVDRWGNKWLYLGDTDEEILRVAKVDENGLVDIATLGHISSLLYDCHYNSGDYTCYTNATQTPE